MSHAFNVLDARGAVGVTERAACFAALRYLSREVAKLWVERRGELGHPLGHPPAGQAAAWPGRRPAGPLVRWPAGPAPFLSARWPQP